MSKYQNVTRLNCLATKQLSLSEIINIFQLPKKKCLSMYFVFLVKNFFSSYNKLINMCIPQTFQYN